MSRALFAIALLGLLAVAAAEEAKTTKYSKYGKDKYESYKKVEGKEYEEEHKSGHKKALSIKLTETTDTSNDGKSEHIGGNTWATTTLKDSDGDVVGHGVWTGVIYATGKANWVGTLTFSEGSIVLSGPGESEGGELGVSTFVVLGGSGKFVGVSGTAVYDSTADPDTYVITLYY